MLRRGLSQLSYFHKPGKQPLLPWTLADVLDKTADAKGDNKAIVSCHQGITKTYTEYRNDINQFAASLMSLNLPVGSMIGIMAPNLYEWGVVQFAAAKAGLVLVNISTAYQVPELEHCLNHPTLPLAADQYTKIPIDEWQNSKADKECIVAPTTFSTELIVKDGNLKPRCNGSFSASMRASLANHLHHVE
ncbi:hypothetical protein ISCGN_026663 [Ixodes scapularis]